MAAPKDIKRIISTVVAADCRLGYAAEILKTTQAELMLALVSDTESLSEQLRTSLIIKLFETLMMTQTAFQAQIADLSPEAVARAYTSQMTAFAALTHKPTDVEEAAPQTIAEARQELMDRLANYAEREDNKIEDAASS